MLTGSMVSSLQGEPRSTHDMDFVVALDITSAAAFIQAIRTTGCYFDEERVPEAIESSGMFNLIDPTAGLKVDFWMLTTEPFDKSRFKRKIQEDVLGMALWVSSPEDTILAKLSWSKLSGGSQKQLNDAVRVYEIQHSQLDLEYVERWVEKLDLGTEWRTLLDEADPIDL
jgi:hypothetical protein